MGLDRITSSNFSNRPSLAIPEETHLKGTLTVRSTEAISPPPIEPIENNTLVNVTANLSKIIDEAVEPSPEKALENSSQILTLIDGLKKENQAISDISQELISDSKEKAVTGLKGTTYGLIALQDTYGVVADVIGTLHTSPHVCKLLKVISHSTSQIGNVVLAGLKLVTAPIEFVVTRNTKQRLNKYLENLQHTLTPMSSDRKFIEELINDLRDKTKSFDEIAKKLDEELNGLPSKKGLSPFSIIQFMHPGISEEKIIKLDSEKEKKKLLNLLADTSSRNYLLDRRNDALAYEARHDIISLLEGPGTLEEKLKTCLALQNHYIHEFITAEDFPGEKVDNFEAILNKVESDPQFHLMLNERIQVFLNDLKTDPTAIKKFNTRYRAHEEKVQGMQQMLKQRQKVAEQSFNQFIEKACKTIEQKEVNFTELKVDFEKHGINFDEIGIENIDQLKELLSSPGRLKELFTHFKDPSEALLASSRNGLKALAQEKAIATKDFFKFNWLKTKLMFPLELISSVLSLVAGILILAGAIAAPPLFITVIGASVFALGTGFMIGGFIHQLRYKPRTLYENTLKLRGLRQWFREVRYNSIKNERAKQAKQLQVKKLLNELISVRLSRQTYTEEIKKNLIAIENDIPKNLREILIDHTRELSAKETKKLASKQEAYLKKIVKIEKDLVKSKTELAKRKEELLVHVKAISEAGLKDAMHGGVSFRTYFGIKPRTHKTSRTLELVFPKYALPREYDTKETQLKETPTQKELMGLIEALVELEKNKRLDDETKAFLKKQLNIDLKALKDNNKTALELTNFFGGGVSKLNNIVLKQEKTA